MKHAKETLFLVALLLTPLFMAGIGMPSVSIEKNVLEPTPEKTMTKAYDTHGAIRIMNDTDFLDQATVESWPGDGSVDTPFLIEGWNISVDDTTPIWIRDTSYHFIIQDCYLTVGTGWNSASGIYLHNATNGNVLECVIHHVDTGINTNNAHGLVVEGCTIYDCDNGIYLMGNDYVASQNTVYDCIYGIALEEVLDSVVHGNEIYLCDQYGLFMGLTSHCDVTENTIYSNGDCGIYLNTCPNVRIEGNIIFDNSHVFEACGINMQETDDALILNNHIENNTWTGIYLFDSQRPYIAGNTIANNSNHGIIGSYSENVTIHENDIYHNGWWWVEDYSPLSLIGGITAVGTGHWDITANSIWNNTGAGVYVVDAA
ncbi:MAG: right-handed parallel beta-helix repeat-containing protein, partial [Candidatus Thorarchaeota archaeon]